MPNKDLNLNIGELQKAANRYAENDLVITPASFDVSTRVDNFSKYDKGFTPRFTPGGDDYSGLMEHRAKTQPNSHKFANMLTRGVGKMAISMFEPLGYLADVEHIFGLTDQYDEEYSNWWNESLKGLEEDIDKSMPIYTEDEKPNIGSFDWWVKHGDQMLKSVGYIVPAGFVAGAASKALKGSKIFETVMSNTSAAMARKVASPLTSAIALNYNEHMRSASEAYAENKGVYYENIIQDGLKKLNKQVKDGSIDQEAYDKLYTQLTETANKQSKEKAAADAADIITSGKINIPLELVEYMTLFKFMGGTRAFTPRSKSSLMKAFGKAGVDNLMYRARVMGKDMGLVGLSEFWQEVNTGHFENEARRKPLIESGELADDRSGTSRYLEHLGSYEGLTEGLSGFIGGAGMQIASNIAARTARRQAYESLKQQAEMMGDGVRFDEATRNEFLDNIVRPALEFGTTQNVLNTLDVISGFDDQQAQDFQFTKDFREKASRFKDYTLELEESYNALTLSQEGSPFKRELLLNLRRNSIVARDEYNVAEEKIKELSKKLNADELNHPLYKSKELSRDIWVKRNALAEALREKELLASPTERSNTTNETRGEIEERIRLLARQANDILEEQGKVIKDYIFEKHPTLDKESDPVEVSINPDNNFTLVTPKVPGVEKTAKAIEDYFEAESTVERGIKSYKVQQAQAASIRDNADRMYSVFNKDAKRLDQYEREAINYIKERKGLLKNKLDDAKTVKEIDDLIIEEKHPDIIAYAKRRKEILANEEKIKEAVVKSEAKSGKPTTPVVPATPSVKESLPPKGISAPTAKASPPSTSSLDKGSTEEVSTVAQSKSESKTPAKTAYKSKSLQGFKYGETVEKDKYVAIIKDGSYFKLTLEAILEDATVPEYNALGQLAEIQQELREDLKSLEENNLDPAMQEAIKVMIKYTKDYELDINNIQAELEKNQTTDNKTIDEKVDDSINKYAKPQPEKDEYAINDTRVYRRDTNDDSELFISTIQARKMNKGRIKNTKDINFQNLHGATSGAFLHRGYIVDKDGVKHSIGEIIQRENILQEAEAGTELRFILDDNPIAEKAISKDNPSYRDLVSIKIQTKQDGKWVDTDVWMHDVEWLQENTPDSYMIGDQLITGNIQTQVDLNRQMRDYVLKQLDSKKEALGVIEAVREGKLQYNVKQEKNQEGVLVDVIEGTTGKPLHEYKSVFEALPGVTNNKKAQFGISKDGVLYSSPTSVSQIDFDLGSDVKDGTLFAIYPTKKGDSAVPIFSNLLGDSNNKVISDIFKSVRVTLSNFLKGRPVDGNAALWLNKPKEAGKDSPLVSYLDQFINIRNKIVLDPTEESKRALFGRDENRNLEFGINQNEVLYKIEETPDGTVNYLKETTKGKKSITSDVYTKALLEALSITPLSIKMDKINTKGEYTNPFGTYSSYNDFVGNTLTTLIDGTHKLPSGYYTPSLQPDIQFSIPALEEIEVDSVDSSTEAESKVADDYAKKHGLPDDFSIPTGKPVNFTTLNVNFKPVTSELDIFKNLEEEKNTVNSLLYLAVNQIFDKNHNLRLQEGKTKKLLGDVLEGVKEKITNLHDALDTAIHGEEKDKVAVKAYLKKYFGLSSDTQIKTALKDYNEVLDNYSALEERLITELETVGLIDEVANKDSVVDDNMGERVQYSPELAIQVDPKSVSKELRLMLSTIPDVRSTKDGQVYYKNNKLYFPQMGNIDYIFDNLANDLADKVKTVDEAIAVLSDKKLLSQKPIYANIIKKLTAVNPDGSFTTGAENFRTLLSNVLFRTKEDLIKTISYPIIGENYEGYSVVTGYNLINFSLNDQSGYKAIINSWSEHQKRIPLTRLGAKDARGKKNLIIDQNKAKAIQNKFKNAYEEEVALEEKEKQEVLANPKLQKTAFVRDEYINKIVDGLKELGIQTDRESFIEFASAVKNRENRRLTKVERSNLSNWIKRNTNPEFKVNAVNPFLGGLMKGIFDPVLSNKPFVDEGFQYDNNTYRKYIEPLAKATYANNDVLSSLSSLNSNNDVIYSIQNYNRLSSIISLIKSEGQEYLKQLTQTSIASQSPLIARLLNDYNEVLNFNLQYYDQLNLEKSLLTKSAKIDRPSSGKAIQNAIAIALFQNRGDSIMKLPSLTFGDSSRSPVISSNRVVFNIKVEQDYKVNINPLEEVTSAAQGVNTIDYFMNFIEGEAKRIRKARQLIKQGKFKFKTPEYQAGATRFILNGWLDEQNLQDLVNTPLVETNTNPFITEKEFLELYINHELQFTPSNVKVIRRMLTEVLENQINEQFRDFIDTGIIEFKNNRYSSRFMDNKYITLNKKAKQLNDSQVIRDTIAQFTLNNYAMNIEQQLLLLGDPAHFTKAQGRNIDYAKTAESIQKRLKSALSPTIVGNIEEKSYSRVIINDPTISTKIKKLLDRGYDSIVATDGFEWLNAKEYLRYLKGYNLISPTAYKSMMTKIDQAINDPKNTDNYYEFTPDEVASIQILKPLSFTNRFDRAHDTMYSSLTKSAFLGMFPQMTRQFPDLDRLRQHIENNNIDRVSYSTAVKVKDNTVANIYDSKGNINENLSSIITSDHISILNREFDGLQSIEPPSKTQILTVTQANRNLFYGLRDINDFSFRGNTYTARQLELLKEDIRIKLYDEGFKSLDRNLGITITEHGDLRFNNLSNVQSLLAEEAKSRKWQLNSIAALKLTEDKTAFVLPLLYNSELERVQSVLFSAINKQLVKHKLPGIPYVQMPGLDFKTKIEDSANIENYNNIIFTDSYNGKEGLQFIRSGKNTTNRAQIIVPWNFKDNNGNLLDIKDFVVYDLETKKTRLDYSKLPKELLEGIGLRIPNQSHSNMLPFEIVGFLPSNYDSVVIVPSEIVNQMGSDFDIDKLYSYLRNYYYNPLTGGLTSLSREDNIYVKKKEALADLKKKIEDTEDLIDKLRQEANTLFERDKKRYAAISTINKRLDTLKRLRDVALLKEEIEGENDAEIEAFEKELGKQELTIDKLKLTKENEVIELANKIEEHYDNIKIYREFQKIINQKFTERNLLNQDYLDIFNSVLTHPAVYEKMSTALELYDIYEEAENYIQKGYVDTNSWLYQRDSYISQQSSQDLISTFVLNGSLAAILEGKEGVNLIKLNSDYKPVVKTINLFKGKDGSPLPLYKLNDMGNSEYIVGEGDKQVVKQRTSSNNFVMFGNLVVDNSNKPTAGYINVNDTTAGVISMLSMLKTSNNMAIGVQEILAFINQPIIKELHDNMHMSKANEPMSSKKELMTEAIFRTQRNYENWIGNTKNNKEVANKHFSLTELKNNLEFKLDRQYLLDQLEILKVFSELNEYYNELSKVRNLLLTTHKNGIGSNYAEVLSAEVTYDAVFKNNYSFSNIDSLVFNKKDRDGIDINGNKVKFGELTEYGYYLLNSIKVGKAAGEVLGFNANVIQDLINNVKQFYGSDDLTTSRFKKITNFIRAYTFAGSSILYNEDVNNLRVRLMNNTETNLSLAREIENLMDNPKYANNTFLKTLYFDKSPSVPGIDIINHKFTSKLNLTRERAMEGLNELLQDPDPKVRETGEKIVKYTFVIGQPYNANYQQDIDFNYLEGIGFFNSLSNIELDGHDVFKAYIQHNPKETPNINLADRNLIPLEKGKPVIKGFYAITKDNQQDRFYHGVTTLQVGGQNAGITHLYERISTVEHNNKLYGLYVKIPVYGGINIRSANFVEGNIMNPNAPSMMPINNYLVNKDIDLIKNPPIDKTKNKQNRNSVFKTTFLKDGDSAISAISNSKTNAHNTALANIYERVLRKLGISGKVIVDNSIEPFAIRRDDNIIFNERLHHEMSMNKHKMAGTLLHEANHLIVGDAINNWLGDRSKNPTKVNAIISRIEDIKNTTLDSLIATKPDTREVVESMRKKVDSHKANGTPLELTTREAFYYPFYNVKEFIAKALEGGKFSEYLNRVEYKKGKTILQQLKEFVRGIVKTIIEAFGINVKENSALEATIASTFELITDIVENKDSIFEQKVQEDSKVDKVNYPTLDKTNNDYSVSNTSNIINKFNNLASRYGIQDINAANIFNLSDVSIFELNKELANITSNIKARFRDINKGTGQLYDIRTNKGINYREALNIINRDNIDYSIAEVKEGVDFVFEQNPELVNIGTKEQYSQYLDTIFPDSKVKDIVYHKTPFSFERFEKPLEERKLNKSNKSDAIFFNFENKGFFRKSEGAKTISVIINTNNNIVTNEKIPYATGSKQDIRNILQEDFDSITVNKQNGSKELLVFEPEQIHILGSKQDIKEFKEFVNTENITNVDYSINNELDNQLSSIEDSELKSLGIPTLNNLSTIKEFDNPNTQRLVERAKAEALELAIAKQISNETYNKLKQQFEFARVIKDIPNGSPFRRVLLSLGQTEEVTGYAYNMYRELTNTKEEQGTEKDLADFTRFIIEESKRSRISYEVSNEVVNNMIANKLQPEVDTFINNKEEGKALATVDKYNNHYFENFGVLELDNGKVKINNKRLEEFSNYDKSLYRDDYSIVELNEEKASKRTSHFTDPLRLNLRYRINMLEYSITKHTPQYIKDMLYNRIKELRDDINAINDFAGIESVNAVGNRELNYVEKLLQTDSINPIELRLAGNILDMWKLENSSVMLSEEQLDNPKGVFYQTFQELDNRANELEHSYREALLDYTRQVIEETIPPHMRDEKGITNKDLEIISETSEIIANVLDTSMSRNYIVQAIDDIVKRAQNNQIFEKNRMRDVISNVFEELKKDKIAMSKVGKDYDLFWQKDEDGELTGAMTSLYSKKWDDIYNRYTHLRDKIYRDPKLSKSAKAGELSRLSTDHKNKTETIDLRFLGIYGEFKVKNPKKYPYKTTSEYKKYLIDQFGEPTVDELVSEAKIKQAQYLEDKNRQFEAIDNDPTIENKEDAKNDWELHHNPRIVLDYINQDISHMSIPGRPSERYIVRVPKRKTNKGEDTGYYDKNYEIIQKDKTLSNFHKAYSSLMQNAMNMLPYLIAKDLPYNYLAVVHADLIKQLSNAKGSEKLTVLLDSLNNALTSNSVLELNATTEKKYQMLDSKKQVEKTIPVPHVGKLDMNKRSKDLEVLLTLFTEGAINYDFKNQVKDQVEMIYKVLDRAKEIRRNADNNAVLLDSNNHEQAVEGGALTTKKWGRHTINALLYGEKTTKPKASNKPIYPVESIFGMRTPIGKYKNHDELKEFIERNTGKELKDRMKRYELAKEIELLRDELDSKLELGEIDEVFYNSKMKYLEEKYRELGGKNLVYANIGEALMKITQMKGMGLNLTAGIANLSFGMVANIIHSNGRREFTFSELLKAQGLILQSMFSSNATRTKIFKILEQMDLLFEVVDTNYDSAKPSYRYKPLRNLSPYIIQHKTEYFIQGSSAIAHLLHTKINTKNGEMSLFDAFNDNGVIDLSLLDEVGQKDWDSVIGPESNNEFVKLRKRIIQMNKYLHGNYDPSSPMLIKKSQIGRAVMQFRSWIPMGFMNRFGEEKPDLQLGRNYKGRWRTYGTLGFAKSVSTLLKQVTYQKDALIDLSAVDEENMRKNLAEIATGSSMLLITIALLLSIEEDDEEKNAFDYTAMLLANPLYRARQDIVFYFNPMTIYEVLRDPIPLTKSITDVLTAMNATMKYLNDPDGYRGDAVYSRIARAFPLLGQIPKTKYLMNNSVEKGTVFNDLIMAQFEE